MERLTNWHKRLMLDELRAVQQSIDREQNDLSKMLRILRARQQWLIEERDRNFDKYLSIITSCEAVSSGDAHPNPYTMSHLVNQLGSADDGRASLTLNPTSYTTDDLWVALRNERKNKNRITVVTMLRRALRRQLRYAVLLLSVVVLTASCGGPSRLTSGELEALEAYGRAEYRELIYTDRIYYVDSTTIWTPCGNGWYCRSREIEKYMQPTPEN